MSFAVAPPEVCKVMANKSFDRQIDINLPNGKLVSVVGHRHPTRESGQWDVESALPAILALSKPELSHYLSSNPKWPQQIHESISSEKTALRLYEEDYKRLESYLDRGIYSSVGVEAPVGRIDWINSHYKQMITNSSSAFELLKVDLSQRRAFKLFAFSPQFLLKTERPSIYKDRTIFSAEPTIDEIKKYNEQVCSKIVAANEPNEFKPYVAFLTSVKSHHPEKISEIEGFDNRLNKVDEKLLSVNPMLQKSRFNAMSLAAEMIKDYPVTVTAEEKDELVQYFRIKLENASHFSGCSAREALLAKNLVKQAEAGSVINFIGAKHLPALAHYLEEECLKLNSVKANPAQTSRQVVH
jgi:hypothetical protein